MRPSTLIPLRRDTRASGFTLVEILIVVVILGILAAIVVPAFSNQATEAEQTAFCSNLKQYANGYLLYMQRHGRYPADETPGILPAGMENYFDPNRWTHGKPLGGRWDWDYQQFGCTAGVSVYEPTRSDAQMAIIDGLLDDGDLTTGAFRKRANGFIYIIQP